MLFLIFSRFSLDHPGTRPLSAGPSLGPEHPGTRLATPRYSCLLLLLLLLSGADWFRSWHKIIIIKDNIFVVIDILLLSACNTPAYNPSPIQTPGIYHWRDHQIIGPLGQWTTEPTEHWNI